MATLGTFWRHPGSTLLTAGVISIALLVPASIYLLVDAAQGLTRDWRGGHQISAFLYPDVQEKRARELARELEQRSEVVAARLITRAQALEEFRAAMGITGALENLGDENPLPAVVVLSPAARDGAGLRRLADLVAEHGEVELVQMDELWLDRLSAMLTVAERALWLTTAVLGVGVVLVVGNTLRLTVEARRSEIEVEKLFGASDAFVRRPFLYHGAVYGMAGALLALVIIYLGLTLLAPPVRDLITLYGGALAISPPSASQALLLLVAGPLLGWLGSWLSVTRHLKKIEPR